MGFISLITSNPIINATIISWFITQFLKVVIVLLTEKKFDYERFVGAEGCPVPIPPPYVLFPYVSAGRLVSSPEFAIAFVFSLIIMYDAAGVRRAAGQQATVLNKMLDNWYNSEHEFTEIELKEFGPYTLQVVVGAVIGILIGLFAVI